MTTPDRVCRRCGTPTVYVSGVCGYCQQPGEQRVKASERSRLLTDRCGCGHASATHDPRCYQPGCACLTFTYAPQEA